jgi:hypothetical protein
VAQLKQAAFRVDDELMARIDRMLEVIQRSPDYAGMEVTRSTVIRAMVMRGLASFELRYGVAQHRPDDDSAATAAYWKRCVQDAEQELEAIRRRSDEYWKRMHDEKADLDWEPFVPSSEFYRSGQKKK